MVPLTHRTACLAPLAWLLPTVVACQEVTPAASPPPEPSLPAAAPPPVPTDCPLPEFPPEYFDAERPYGDRLSQRPYHQSPLVVISDDPAHCPARTVGPEQLSIVLPGGQCVHVRLPFDEYTRIVFAPVSAPQPGAPPPAYRMCFAGLGSRKGEVKGFPEDPAVTIPLGPRDLPGGRPMVLEGVPVAAQEGDSDRWERERCEPGLRAPVHVAHLQPGDPLPWQMSVSAMEAWHKPKKAPPPPRAATANHTLSACPSR
jgi:hypothetical protein